jgi:hypothetical protein
MAFACYGGDKPRYLHGSSGWRCAWMRPKMAGIRSFIGVLAVGRGLHGASAAVQTMIIELELYLL